MMLLVGSALFLALAWIVAKRAVYYDELFTLYVTGSQFGWYEALTRHWLFDNHPPLYYALSRATAGFGESAGARRILNLLIALAAFAAGATAAGRRRGSAGDRVALASVYFLCLASQDAVFPFAAELRSYFLSWCTIAVLTLSITTLWLDGAPLSQSRRAVLFGSILVAFNIHILTSVLATSLILPFVALALARRDWRRLRMLTLPAAMSGLIFCGTVAVQAGNWMSNTTAFWIPSGIDQVTGSYALIAQYATSANWLLTFAGMGGLALLAAEAIRRRMLSAELELALLIATGLVLVCLAGLAIHMWRPMVVPKYFVGMFPMIAMILALGFCAMSRQLSPMVGGALLVASVGLSLISIGRSASQASAQPGWDQAARVIAREVSACPDTTVHAEMNWNRAQMRMPPPDSAQVVPWAYHYVAGQHGFTLEPENSRRMSKDCPTIFWGYAAGEDPPDMALLVEYEQTQGFPINRLEFYRIHEGWIGSTQPLDVTAE